jgi:YegS/Rv2252/BmrU family lipid kinase
MRAMIVFNPIAGQASAFERDLNVAAQVWRNANWQVDLQPTQEPGDGVRLARQAVEQQYDVVIAAGGDGTINEVVNGLAGSNTALATLPLGTVNVWARELGLPLNPRAAAEAMLSWQTRSIDLGRAGERYFLLMAGIGFDAEVAAGVRPEEKRRFGALAYVIYGLDRLIRVRGSRAVLKLDGRKVKGRVMLIVAGNSQLYGGVVKITHRATIDDGLLDVCVIKGDGLWSALVHAVAILRRRYSLDTEIEYYRARHITITARPSLPVQVDGDTFGKTPITLEVMPGALQALMPSRLPDELVRHQHQHQQPVVAIPSPSLTSHTIKQLVAWLMRKNKRKNDRKDKTVS